MAALAQGQTVSEWVKDMQGCECSRATAYRMNKELLASGAIVLENGRLYATDSVRHSSLRS